LTAAIGALPVDNVAPPPRRAVPPDSVAACRIRPGERQVPPIGGDIGEEILVQGPPGRPTLRCGNRPQMWATEFPAAGKTLASIDPLY